MIRKLFLPALAIYLLALPLAGQTDVWKKYDNRDGSFSVLFPGEPKDSDNNSDAGVRSHTLMASHERAIYTVIYTAHSSPQTVNSDNYEVFKNAVFKQLPKCTVGAEQAPAPALDGYIGHWYHMTCNIDQITVLIDGNLYWGKNYAYAVMVMYRADVPQPSTEQKFWESFSVLPAANSGPAAAN